MSSLSKNLNPALQLLARHKPVSTGRGEYPVISASFVPGSLGGPRACRGEEGRGGDFTYKDTALGILSGKRTSNLEFANLKFAVRQRTIMMGMGRQ